MIYEEIEKVCTERKYNIHDLIFVSLVNLNCDI
jgi:hypothetical protein